MTKVHPHIVSPTSPRQEIFTVWMKSLIFSSNGCVVFDSNGRIKYRVDNYSYKCSDRVHIMDLAGKVLFTVVKKKLSVLGLWEGYETAAGRDIHNEKRPVFRVRKPVGLKGFLGFLSGCSLYKVVVGIREDQPCEYMLENQISKPYCRIVDPFGNLVAEVKRKITTSGVGLGEDVLTMVVEPHFDHTLIMGLVIVFGLINHKL